MNLFEFVSLEIGILTLFGGVLAWVVRSFNRRFDKLDASISKIYARMDATKTESHENHLKIENRLTGIETLMCNGERC